MSLRDTAARRRIDRHWNAKYSRNYFMLRRFINPKLADDIKLNRPASNWPERLFRLSLLYLSLVGSGYSLLQHFIPDEELESNSGVPGLVIGSIFGVCFFYMLNFMAYRFIRNQLIRWTWFLLQAFVIFSIAIILLNRK